MAGYQPYGQQPMYAPPPQRVTKMLKTFGITYLAARGLILIGLMLLMLFAASVVTQSQLGGDVGSIVALVVVFFLVWLGYCVAGGVLAIKGYIAGAFMGLVDGVLLSLLGLVSLFTGQAAGGFCWLVPSAAIVVLGILALKERYGAQPAGQPGYGAPAYGAHAYAAAQPAGYGNPGGHYAAPQGYAAPQPAREQPPGAMQGVTSAVVPSPKMAALSILALAASVDPDSAQEALVRARNVAAKLLGPAAQTRIQRQLAQPTAVMDVESDLIQHTGILLQQPNPAMSANVVKAVEYVLKGPQGIEPLGEQFLNTLKQQLGVS
ncbi:MAG: hypothetical protein H6841_01375 [Planctomycetes bacterium]|nr:hypothetical protein [Planctomycetota bacterium]MCB9935581.1 hypothetical protein [Planctomycetota bacterium]